MHIVSFVYLMFCFLLAKKFLNMGPNRGKVIFLVVLTRLLYEYLNVRYRCLMGCLC